MSTTNSTPTSREVFEETQNALLQHDIKTYLEYFADEAMIETKFTQNGQSHIIKGKDAISRALLANQDLPFKRKAFENTVIHETIDPEVIVTEYDMVVEAKHDASLHTISDVLVFRIRDGKIISVRTYSNPVVIAQIMG